MPRNAVQVAAGRPHNETNTAFNSGSLQNSQRSRRALSLRTGVGGQHPAEREQSGEADAGAAVEQREPGPKPHAIDPQRGNRDTNRHTSSLTNRVLATPTAANRIVSGTRNI